MTHESMSNVWILVLPSAFMLIVHIKEFLSNVFSLTAGMHRMGSLWTLARMLTCSQHMFLLAFGSTTHASDSTPFCRESWPIRMPRCRCVVVWTRAERPRHRTPPLIAPERWWRGVISCDGGPWVHQPVSISILSVDIAAFDQITNCCPSMKFARSWHPTPLLPLGSDGKV